MYYQEELDLNDNKADMSIKDAVQYLKDKNTKERRYLSEQILTYLGNKRSLIGFIDSVVDIVKEEMGKDNLTTLDLFSGSGVVARYFKTFASKVYANDLEGYVNRVNHCYLMNHSEFDSNKLLEYYNYLKKELTEKPLKSGFISEMYSPQDDTNIKEGERAFYTTRNGKYIDTARSLLEDIPEPYKTLLMGPLLCEASVKNNTSGVFKGFYKNSKTNIGQFGGNGRNALTRIMSDIEINLPVLCERECEYEIFQEDANELVKRLEEVDLAYLDPPYNQHPYSSNYFMLNLINDYKKPENVSVVAGIPKGWNKSNYNKEKKALETMRELCGNIKAKYVLISFSSDGFISLEEMTEMLKEFGEVRVFAKKYNTFRASRNLADRDIYIKEYLYLLKKQ